MNKDPNDEYNTTFNMSDYTEEQAISNFINLLLTRKGERFMQPLFGVGLMDYVFDQNTREFQDLINDEIVMQSDMWLPYITINKLIIDNTPTQANLNDGHGVGILISFTVNNSGANRTMSIFKVNGRPIIRVE